MFSAANSVIPEIGSINDWDNVAIVMKFPTGTLAQVNQSNYEEEEEVIIVHFVDIG